MADDKKIPPTGPAGQNDKAKTAKAPANPKQKVKIKSINEATENRKNKGRK
jgi:hypothetical protein